MTNVNNLQQEILRELKRYTSVVAEKIEVAKNETSKDLVKELKRSSPQNRPRYYKGWRVKKVKNKNVIHNQTDYQLTHLLEHGYVKRNGERQPAQVHIRPAEERAVNDFLDKIEQAVKK